MIPLTPTPSFLSSHRGWFGLSVGWLEMRVATRLVVSCPEAPSFLDSFSLSKGIRFKCSGGYPTSLLCIDPASCVLGRGAVVALWVCRL